MATSRYTRPASGDEDAITPCPLALAPTQGLLDWEQLHHRQQLQHQQQYAERAPSPLPPLSLTSTSGSSSPFSSLNSTPSRASSRRWRIAWRDSLDDEGRFRPDYDSPPPTAVAGKQQQLQDVDPGVLWRRMLAIQRVFGCYNSARMRAAVDEGWEGSQHVPSRTCLELLNDSIDQLPEHTRRELDGYLRCGGSLASPATGSSPSSKRISWRQRLMRIAV